MRSRLDIRLGRTLTVGQRLRRRRDSSIWTIAQLHRYDCEADLRHQDGRKITVPFKELREQWEKVVPVEAAA